MSKRDLSPKAQWYYLWLRGKMERHKAKKKAEERDKKKLQKQQKGKVSS